jgi:hypothetical protein
MTMQKFIICVRRRGKDKYSVTNWGSDFIEKALDNAVSIMETIENDTIGDYVKYRGMYRFTGVRIENDKGKTIYEEERS